jgi:peptide/nickel transport system permease protein
MTEHTASHVRVDRGESLLVRQAKAFLAVPSGIIGLAILLLIVALAVAAPVITVQNPYDLMQLDILDGMLPPGAISPSGAHYWLGTDEQGRDMLSAILYGMRISLGVGLIATVLAGALGAALGVVAAYAGGRFDSFLMRVVDLQLSLPTILIALVIVTAFGRGIDKVIVALVVVQWAYYARTVRAAALVERKREYIEAARCLVLPWPRIVFRHLLPNCLPPLIVVATVQIAHAIALEATLSFLGVGVPVTEPSLGMLIAKGFDHLLSGRYWVSTFPGAALVIAIVAINMIGDRLRDVLNPRLSL